MVSTCQHCGKVRILVARVSRQHSRSDSLYVRLLALRLLSGDDVHGALTVVPLCDDQYVLAVNVRRSRKKRKP